MTIQTQAVNMADEQTTIEGQKLAEAIQNADAVVVGIGAGMSSADGYKYIGPRFTDHFPDFIKKYNLFDMLQASLFDFEDLQEYWAFQSRFVALNYLDQPVGQSYLNLKDMLAAKDYHVITTNADNSFYAAGYDMDKVHYYQGEYALWQCSAHCHNRTYRNDETIREMIVQQSDMKISVDLIPYCSECGAPMQVNKRNAETGMVESPEFDAQAARYQAFLDTYKEGNVVYLEIGVGNTTPQFIKEPFQKMTAANPEATFITMNQKNYRIPTEIRPRTLKLKGDIAAVIEQAKLITQTNQVAVEN